jgi:hypothetical protein
MSGTSECPQVSSAIPTVNIYYDELTMRVFNNQLKVSEIETSSYLIPFPFGFNTRAKIHETELITSATTLRGHHQRNTFRFVAITSSTYSQQVSRLFIFT